MVGCIVPTLFASSFTYQLRFLDQVNDRERSVQLIDLNSTHKDFPCHADHRWIEGRSRGGPLEKLRNTIDLVVISPIWKCQQFKQEGVEPISLAREIDVSMANL